jgi:hypothetical protein
MPAFNQDFDKDFGDRHIVVLQESVGCFACHKPDPVKTCSRCKIAKYCDQTCQKKDWTRKEAGNHKEECSFLHDNDAFAVPIALGICGWLSDQNLSEAMIFRQRLFLEEVKRSCEGENMNMDVGCQTCAVYLVHKIYLVVLVTLIDAEFNRVMVNHVVLEEIDQGDEAMGRLYPTYGSGSLSEVTKEKVLVLWVAFAVRLQELGISIRAVTYGRGLNYLNDDAAFKKQVDTAHGRPITWCPDMAHAMNDVMGAAMNAGMSS